MCLMMNTNPCNLPTHSLEGNVIARASSALSRFVQFLLHFDNELTHPIPICVTDNLLFQSKLSETRYIAHQREKQCGIFIVRDIQPQVPSWVHKTRSDRNGHTYNFVAGDALVEATLDEFRIKSPLRHTPKEWIMRQVLVKETAEDCVDAPTDDSMSHTDPTRREHIDSVSENQMDLDADEDIDDHSPDETGSQEDDPDSEEGSESEEEESSESAPPPQINTQSLLQTLEVLKSTLQQVLPATSKKKKRSKDNKRHKRKRSSRRNKKKKHKKRKK